MSDDLRRYDAELTGASVLSFWYWLEKLPEDLRHSLTYEYGMSIIHPNVPLVDAPPCVCDDDEDVETD